MPLQNRVDPFGRIVATPDRGTLMGNRGGRIHDPSTKTLGSRRWASKAWIACRISFGNRHRTVMGNSYTELFFLDEVTALAAGHRPCFECRRHDALAFARAFAGEAISNERPRAREMDTVLHAERLEGREKRVNWSDVNDLPDGAVIVIDGNAYALTGGRMLKWSRNGYSNRRRRPHDGRVGVLTPPSIISALCHGYRPQWHESARQK